MDLFDVIEIEADREKPICPHRHEKLSETVWPGETETRLTMTCKSCGRIRGRYPKEQET